MNTNLQASASMKADGSPRFSDGVEMMTKVGVGTYTVSLTDMMGSSECCPNVSLWGAAQRGGATCSIDGTGKVVTVETFDSAGALSDQGFCLLVYRVAT